MATLCRHLFIACILLPVIAALFSCSPSPRLDDYAYYRLNFNPTTLDPALIVDVQGASLAAKLFNGLVRLNEDLSVAPDIAERWELSKDGRSYRFFIRKGVAFANGREVRAEDFKYSFERILDPRTKSPNTWVLEKVRGAKAFMDRKADTVAGFRVRDAYTFEITLERPFAPFLGMLTMSAAYVVPREEVERWGSDFSSHVMGTGPFVLERWLPNREVVLQRNERYFDRPAKVKGIVCKIIPEDLTAITEFELGSLDVLSLPGSAYGRFRADERWSSHIIALQGVNTYYLGLNTAKPPFDNKRLRKAVAAAIDRNKILETFFEKRGRPAAGPVPDLLRKWSLSPEGVHPYDPAAARAVIEQEGRAGVRVTMYITADQEVVDLAEIVQSYLLAAGISVQIRQLEWSAYKEAINRGEPHLFWLSWWADYPDAENFLFPLFHSSNLGSAGNRTRYVNKTVDALIEKGQYSFDERERSRYYREAESMIVEDAPWVPFWHRNDILVKQPWVEGLEVYPITSMDKGTEIALRR
ncbi:MAG: ABC transporter substrate-binding protein [Nitrospirota bacterium]